MIHFKVDCAFIKEATLPLSFNSKGHEEEKLICLKALLFYSLEV